PGEAAQTQSNQQSVSPAARVIHVFPAQRSRGSAPGGMTRREFLALLAAGTAGAGMCWAQESGGMASRGVRPQPRGKPSGLPFHARFTDVAAHAGLCAPVIYGPPDRMNYILESMGCGVAFLDYDNDGWLDIFLPSGTRREGPVEGATNRLYKNNRDGTFTDVTAKAGLVRQGWTCGVTVGDYNNDGFEDLFITGWPQNILYRNDGDGTFTDVTERSGVGSVKPGFGLTAVAADLDGDGWQDVYVACDSTPSLVFRNRGDGTFAEQGLLSGLAVNEDGNEQAGMGIAIGDFDTDGRLDALKTHFAEDTVALYRNAGHLGFEDVTLRAGLGVETRYVGWGDGLADLANDGLPALCW